MRELFYLVAALILLVSVVEPERVGAWLQKVDAARYDCDTMPCWNESIAH